MRLLDRLVLRELIGPFLFGVAAFASIFFAGGDLMKIISDMVKGMPIGAAFELIALRFPYILVMVLPMGVLLSVLLAMGRLSSDSEIVSIYAGGVSLYRIVVAVFALGIAASILTFVLNENIVPVANSKSREIRTRLLRQDAAFAKPVPFADVRNGVTNSLVYVQGGMDPQTKTLRDVMVILFSKNSPRSVFIAKMARWEGGDHGQYTWRLRDGHFQSLVSVDHNNTGIVYERFDSTTIRLRQTFKEMELYQKRADELNFSQLLGHIRKLHGAGAPTSEEEIDLYNKIALPLSAFVFAVLAASLGIRSHRGGSSVGLGLSVLIIFIYWIVHHFMSALASQGTLPPLVGAFSASVVTLTAGVGLLVRAAR